MENVDILVMLFDPRSKTLLIEDSVTVVACVCNAAERPRSGVMPFLLVPQID